MWRSHRSLCRLLWRGSRGEGALGTLSVGRRTVGCHDGVCWVVGRRSIFLEHLLQTHAEQTTSLSDAEVKEALQKANAHLADALQLAPTMAVIENTVQSLTENGVKPDDLLFCTAIRNLMSKGAITEAQTLLAEMESRFDVKPSLAHYKELLYFLARQGKQQKLFFTLHRDMPAKNLQPNASSYSAIAAGAARSDLADRAVLIKTALDQARLLKQWKDQELIEERKLFVSALLQTNQVNLAMQELLFLQGSGSKNDQIFNMAIPLLLEKGHVEDARSLFGFMRENPALLISESTYSHLVDYYGKTGELKDLQLLIPKLQGTSLEGQLRRSIQIAQLVCSELPSVSVTSSVLDAAIQGLVMLARRHKDSSRLEKAVQLLSTQRSLQSIPSRSSYIALVDTLCLPTFGTSYKRRTQEVDRILSFLESDGHLKYHLSPTQKVDLLTYRK